MPTTYYDSANGRLRGQRTGGSRTEYLTDALGSVTATVNSTGTVQNTYRYKPYGNLLAKTGSAPDPRHLWTGDTGSRRTLVTFVDQYNQARHYGARQANWTCVDPLWPRELAYGYADGNPTTRRDPLGSKPEIVDGTLKVVKVNGCGKINFQTRWWIPPSQIVKDGAVIQFVQILATCRKCDGTICGGSPFNGNSVVKYQYLEAWPVRNGNQWLNGDLDFFEFFGGAEDCSAGSVDWTAKVSYYPGYLDTNRSPWKQDRQHPSGGLPFIDPFNPLFFLRLGGPPQQLHTLSVRWDCCVKPSENSAKGFFDGLTLEDHHYGGSPNPACLSCKHRY